MLSQQLNALVLQGRDSQSQVCALFRPSPRCHLALGDSRSVLELELYPVLLLIVRERAFHVCRDAVRVSLILSLCHRAAQHPRAQLLPQLSRRDWGSSLTREPHDAVDVSRVCALWLGFSRPAFFGLARMLQY